MSRLVRPLVCATLAATLWIYASFSAALADSPGNSPQAAAAKAQTIPEPNAIQPRQYSPAPATDFASLHLPTTESATLTEPTQNSLCQDLQDLSSAPTQTPRGTITADPKAAKDNAESSEPAFKISGNIDVVCDQKDDLQYDQFPETASTPTYPQYPEQHHYHNLNSTTYLAGEYDQGPLFGKLAIKYDANKRSTVIRDYYLGYRFGRSTITVGQFKRKFGIEGMQPSNYPMLINDSDLTDTLYRDRDLGLAYGYEFASGIKLDISIVNGQGMNKADTNSSKDVCVRCVFPLNKFSDIGVSGDFAAYRPQGQQNDVPIRTYGLDYEYDIEHLVFRTELMYSNGYNKVALRPTTAWGTNLGCTLKLSPEWDVVASYDWFDPDTERVSPYRYDSSCNARERLTVGFNYYIDRQAPHRFVLNYEILRPTEGVTVVQPTLHLKYTYSF